MFPTPDIPCFFNCVLFIPFGGTGEGESDPKEKSLISKLLRVNEWLKVFGKQQQQQQQGTTLK